MMRQVQIGFSRNHGPLSWVIRYLTGSVTSHCYVKLPLPGYAVDGEFMVSHAQGLNVHYVHSSLFLAKNEVVEEYAVWVTEEQYQAAERMRWRSAGLSYGWTQILGYVVVLFLRCLFGKLGVKKRVRNPLGDGAKTVVCVEWCMRQLGIDSSVEEDSPEDLRKWCKLNGQLLTSPHASSMK